MAIGPFAVSQVPADPLVLTVSDDDGIAKDVTGYDSIALVMLDGGGHSVDTSAGSIFVDPDHLGRVSYSWPSGSLFTTPGSYRYWLSLDGPGTTHDLTGVELFEVMRVGQVGPNGDDVLSFIGYGADSDPDMLDLAAARLPVVSQYVRALTRGKGFDPTTGDPFPDLAAVIVTAAARELNTEPGVQREEIGGSSFYYGADPTAFTLREMLVIQSYRRRAC